MVVEALNPNTLNPKAVQTANHQISQAASLYDSGSSREAKGPKEVGSNLGYLWQRPSVLGLKFQSICITLGTGPLRD